LTKFITEKKLNPVFVYENLSNSTVKSRVLNETRDLSGIYLILNKITLDYYIGSASFFFSFFFNYNKIITYKFRYHYKKKEKKIRKITC
jgi:hypothetical protein